VLLPLMDRFNLTAYDATYLELALRRNLPLATLDKELFAAARQAGVALVGQSL
jgi:predicted nucleic acid-binding protein